MPEIWKPIAGYEGLYEVSTSGRVRSIDRYIKGKDARTELHRGKILREQTTKNGYKEVSLSLNGRRKHRTVHGLVAEAFLGSRPEKYDVMHSDGDRGNNALTNLSYGTRSNNLRSTYSYGGTAANGKLSLSDVDDIRKRIAEGEPIREIARRYSVNSAAIYHIRSGKTFGWHKTGVS